MTHQWLGIALLSCSVALTACEDDSSSDDDGMDGTPTPDAAPVGVDPDTAPRAMVDRFSATAGTLMVRDAQNGLPAAGAAIDFDQGPFVTQGLAPDGDVVRYYNFDVRSTTPAPIFVLFAAGASAPVAGQLNLIDAIPGDAGYNDFWQVVKVTVPAGYVANTITDVADLGGFAQEPTTMLVNCPVVPEGSTATQRLGGGAAGLQRGWYRGKLVHYFTFEEAAVAPVANLVPTSPIWVTFKVNPDQPGGGPASGFVTEAGSGQTHNVLGSVPGGTGYSPLWSVQVYDNADFASVDDAASAAAATQLGANVATVNCPVVAMP